MFKKCFLLFFLISFKGFSQDYFAPLFSIQLATASDVVNNVLDDSLNNKIYVAGNFTNIAGTPRNYIACFNRSTGVIINSFNANIGVQAGYNYYVKSMHLYNGVLYIGGYFSTVSGQPRANCAAISPTTGALISSFVCNVSGNVNCILDFNNNLYIGGDFFQVNSISRNILAVVSPSTGILQALNPNIGSTGGFGVTKMVLHNSKIYFTTSFATNINGSTRNYLAKIDAATCALDSWNPNPNQQVNDLVVFENELNIIGEFTSIFSTNYNYYVRMNLTSGLPANTTITNIFTDIPMAPMLWACGYWIGNYLSPYSQFGSPGTTIYNYPLQISRFKDKTFINTYYGTSYYDYITLLVDPNNNNKVSSFDYHPCSSSNNGFKFPYINYGSINYGNDIQGVDFLKSVSERLYTTTNRAGNIFYPGQKRIEVLGCMPKVPSNFAMNTNTVCAGTQNVLYKIPKFYYTKQYIWSYSGTGVTISNSDTAATLNFSNNATSGRLTVKCKGVSDRNSLNLTVLNLPLDSVSLNITVNPLPSVNAGPDITLNCSNNKVNTLNGTVTTSGTFNEWNGPSFYSQNLSETVVNKPQGNYVLSSTITATGCSWRDTAYVFVDTLKPNLVMPVITNTRLCCSNPSVNLNASSSTPGVTYVWTNNNGYSSGNPALISTTSPTVPVNNMTYSLTVTKPGNGCVSQGNITLLLDTVHPTFGLGVSTSGAQISCITTTASINGTSGVPRAKLYWNGPGLPMNSPNPSVVNTPATYTLMARDTINGCQSYLNYTVIADTVKPTINPLANTKYLNCDTTQVTLNATSPSANTTFTWTPPVGANLPNPSFVTEAGTYTLNATNVNNGCTRNRYVTVVVDTLKPNLTTNVDSVNFSCTTLSYTLDATTSSSPVTINWSGTGGYTSANPAVITNQGFYTVLIKNTFNGCISTKQIKASIDSMKPYIVPFTNNYQINCTYSTTTMNGVTIPANKYKLTWDGPSAFNSTNPATVSSPGTYTFTALDTITGCKTINYVNVNYLSNLIIDAGNDTIICNGSSANLYVQPIGGTPNFVYSWSNGASTNTTTVSPLDTTSYIVTINDNAGCSGKDTVVVFVPSIIQDSVKAFQPCDPLAGLGQIQVYAYGSIPPYQYALAAGPYQTSNVFANLSYGNYLINIKDNLGCSRTTTAAIDNSSIRPEPNFLISTNMFKSDTFVVVDISNPRPDSVQWTFPPTCTVIDNSNPFSPIIVNSDTGTFVINLKAFFGDCEMNKFKTVHIGNIDTTLANGFNNNGIESITLYPNPNTGQFNVEVKLYKKQTFALLIYDASGVERYRQTVNESNYFNQLINMSPVTNGSYVLRVVAEYDAKQKAFIISQ